MLTKEILKYVGKELKDELLSYPQFSFAEELRIRKDSPAMFYAGGSEFVLNTVASSECIRELMLALSMHSLSVFTDDIKNGFFTVDCGIRIGVAGRAVCEHGQIRMLRDYTSLNIRFPQQLKGIHAAIYGQLANEGNIPTTLIVSAPQHGKTTLLRDLIRAVSAGELYIPKKVCAVDERSELAGSGYFDLGPRTDVLSACPKAEGMRMALRSLSPEVIATDEIGAEKDLEALFEAGNCGVKVLATAHAGSVDELLERMFFRKLMASGFIERTVVLSESLGRGTVENVYAKDGTPLLKKPVLPVSQMQEEKHAV